LGRLDPVKGHEDFMVAASETLRSVPQARFLAAGTGSSSRMEHLQEWAKKRKIDGSLQYLGYVDDAERFIARCRVGVVASLESEAVSRAALEWLSQGRPVIATRVGCLPDMIDDSCGVLVPAGHPG